MNIFEKIIIVCYSFFLSLIPNSSYTEGIVGQPESFLPTQAKTQHDRTISTFLFRGLFKYDIYGTLIPDLADTWSISEDGLVYTIKIKDNQYWSNGKKITADDLIYTSFKTDDLMYVATDRVDDLTVRYTLPNKYAPFLGLLTVGVMPANAEEKTSALFPVSSGDYRVIRIEHSGALVKEVTLLTFKSEYKIKTIHFRFYNDSKEILTAARLGEIQGFLSETALNSDQMPQNFEDYKFPFQGIYYALFFNLREETLKDIELRRKLEKTLKVSTLVEQKGIGVQGPISRSFYTDKALRFDRYDETYKEDLSKIRLVIKVPDTENHVAMAKQVRQIWESKLGMDVDLVYVDPKKFIKDVIEPRAFQIVLFGQEVSRDPDRYISWHSTQKDSPGLNITGFEHVRADRALEEGRKELDPQKRIIHYDEFQKVVVDQVPAIFLYHPFTYYYVSKYVQGIGQKYTFTPSDRFLDLHNWKIYQTN